MSKLIFKAAEVRRVVEHSLKAKEQMPYAYTSDPVEEPSVMLVHDQGVYLMSNGLPRDLKRKGEDGSYVAYAKGCNPARDSAFWDNGRDLVGGDDFAETLPWAKEMKDLLDTGAIAIVIDLNERQLGLEGVYRKK